MRDYLWLILAAIVFLGSIIIFFDEPVNHPAPLENPQLASPMFNDGDSIPKKYTCQGLDINPPLEISNISNVPNRTQSLVLIMDDPDASFKPWVHWVVYDIPPETTVIAENSVPEGASQGTNSWGNAEYAGPCPPSGKHRYAFKLYALDTKLFEGIYFDRAPDKNAVETAMQGHVIGQAQLIGTYSE